jgi:hypothetical protein
VELFHLDLQPTNTAGREQSYQPPQRTLSPSVVLQLHVVTEASVRGLSTPYSVMILLQTSFCNASSHISETSKLTAEKHSTNIPSTNIRLKETRSTTTQRRRQSYETKTLRSGKS